MRHPEGEFVKKKKKISYDFLSHPAPEKHRINLKPHPGGSYLSTYSWAGPVNVPVNGLPREVPTVP